MVTLQVILEREKKSEKELGKKGNIVYTAHLLQYNLFGAGVGKTHSDAKDSAIDSIKRTTLGFLYNSYTGKKSFGKRHVASENEWNKLFKGIVNAGCSARYIGNVVLERNKLPSAFVEKLTLECYLIE